MKIFTAKVFKSKDTVVSTPPSEFKQVVNMYVDPDTGMLVIIQKP